MIKSLKFFIFFSCLSWTGFSQTMNSFDDSTVYQKIIPARYVEFGTGASYLSLRDESTSPLLYRNLAAPYIKLAYQIRSENTLFSFENDFVYSNLSNHVQSDWYQSGINSFYQTGYTDVIYRLRRNKEQKFAWFLGPSLSHMAHIRVSSKFENSALTYDVNWGLGFANRLEKTFYIPSRNYNILGWFNLHRKERLLSLNWQCSMPLINLLLRPAYGNIMYPFFANPDSYTVFEKDNINFGLIKSFYLRSKLEMHYFLHNQNVIKISYDWDFFSFNPGFNKVQSAAHTLSLSLMFKMNKN